MAKRVQPGAMRQATMLKFIDWFIPESSRQIRSEMSLARIFVATHLLGPAFSQSIGVYLLYADPDPNWVVFVVIAGISSFWSMPFMLKYAGDLRTAAFLSFNLLAFTAFFGSFFYGGVTSPFLPWVIIALLLGFFYLSDRPMMVITCFTLTSFLFYLAHVAYGFPERINPEKLTTLGWISIFGAVSYMAWMATFYSTVVSNRHDVELDLSRHKVTAQRLQEAKEIADQANQTRSIFLAKMSHELRTPLNAVIGYSELLLESCEDIEATSQKRRDLGRISSAGKHLLALVDQVMDLSKIESNVIDVRPETVDLREFVEDLEATSRALVDKNANTLVLQIPPRPGTMHSDPTMLRQIMLNLLSNAAKFTKGGTVTLALRRMRVGSEEWVEFSVADTGIGIAEDVLPKLFASFAQASASTSAQFGGSGIGLSVSRKFCTLLGGQITATSTLGSGSKFMVRVPAIFVAESPAGQDADAPRTDDQRALAA
jgi:signal transduction histidine kinase